MSLGGQIVDHCIDDVPDPGGGEIGIGLAGVEPGDDGLCGEGGQ